MVFSSLIFLCIFLPAVLVLYNISRNVTYKNIILVTASLFFYAWGEPLYVFLMMISIAVNHFLALAIDAPKTRKAKNVVTCACVFNLGILFVVKYLPWVMELFDVNFSTLLGG